VIAGFAVYSLATFAAVAWLLAAGSWWCLLPLVPWIAALDLMMRRFGERE
jgi:hypothetical protein